MMGFLRLPAEDLDVPDATFACPDLTTFCRLDELGLVVFGQRLEPDRAVLACRVLEPDEWCRRCGCRGSPRDTVLRRLAHEPFGWRPTTLLVTVRRYRCTGCGHVWRQDTSKAAGPRARLSRRALRWALEAIVCQHLTVAPVAEALAVSWDTANDAVLAEGWRVLIGDPNRLDGVAVIGVDEHCWRHTRRCEKYVTVIIDLTPVRDGAGPARLLDMVDGRSKMVAVMDPFHVVALVGDALERCRQRVQQQTRGHRGRTGDPLYGIRRVLRTGSVLLTDRQRQRLTAVFATEQHVEVEATWGVYQRIVAAYRNHDRAAAKTELRKVIATITAAVPTALTELITLGRTLKRRAADVLAHFDRAGTSNGPTEAINGRLEHLRGSALGFRNLTNYIARSLLETGGFKPQLHRQSG